MGSSNEIKTTIDHSVADFFAAAGPLLYKDEATHSLMLGNIEGLLSQASAKEPLLARVLDNGNTVAAAVYLRRHPQNLILSYATEPQLQALAELFHRRNEDFTGVVGPKNESETFAKIWARLSGKKVQLVMGQKIYKVDKVDSPQNVKGHLAVATDDHVDIIVQWIKAFIEESLPSDQRSDDEWKEYAVNVIRAQKAHLWVDQDQPVSMAMLTRPTKHGISVNAVYTPPASRKRGYASGIVAGLSQKMLDQGKQFCVLYTDLSNPTSNKIYQQVGYREVADSCHFNFI